MNSNTVWIVGLICLCIGLPLAIGGSINLNEQHETPIEKCHEVCTNYIPSNDKYNCLEQCFETITVRCEEKK